MVKSLYHLASIATIKGHLPTDLLPLAVQHDLGLMKKCDGCGDLSHTLVYKMETDLIPLGIHNEIFVPGTRRFCSRKCFVRAWGLPSTCSECGKEINSYVYIRRIGGKVYMCECCHGTKK